MSLSLWVVFDHPLDFPDGYVARRQVASREGVEITDDVITAPTLDDLRKRLERRAPGLTRLARQDGDVPKIVESWL